MTVLPGQGIEDLARHLRQVDLSQLPPQGLPQRIAHPDIVHKMQGLLHHHQQVSPEQLGVLLFLQPDRHRARRIQPAHQADDGLRLQKLIAHESRQLVGKACLVAGNDGSMWYG